MSETNGLELQHEAVGDEQEICCDRKLEGVTCLAGALVGDEEAPGFWRDLTEAGRGSSRGNAR